jgi:uncharacterized protein (TIGR02246 family)
MNDSEEVAAIKRLYDEWKTPWEAGDAAGVARYYSHDAIQLPAGAPDIVGRETFQALLETVFARFLVRGNSTEILEVETAGG